MPKLKLKDTEIKVSRSLVVRMADRIWKLGKARREGYVARAKKRLEAGGKGRNDAAAVLAATPLASH
jgi:hypothetical protein